MLEHRESIKIRETKTSPRLEVREKESQRSCLHSGAIKKGNQRIETVDK